MRGEWLRQCLKTFLFSGCVPFHNAGGCGVEEAMSLDQILKSVLWSLRRLIHPTLQLKQNWNKLQKFFFLPRKWARDWVSPEISFWCCASRLQVGFEMITMNLFISRQKWGENMFRVYFISLVTVMTTTSLPSKLSKMLKDHPAWDKRRFVLVRW